MAQELERRLDQLGIDNQTFQHLEEEFQKVIQELSGDASMERFRREFEKLHRALKDSHEREKELLKQCKRLNDSLTQEAVGVDAAIRITQEDDNKIMKYQSEIEAAQKIIKTLKQNEEKNEGRIHELTNMMKKLEEQLKSSNSMTAGRSNEINDLTSKRDELRARKAEAEDEKRKLEGQLFDLKKTIDIETEKLKSMMDENAQLKKETISCQDKTADQEKLKSKQLADIEQKKKERAEAIIEKEVTEQKRKAVNETNKELEKALQDKTHSKKQLDSTIERLKKDERQLRDKENDQTDLRNKLIMQNKEKEMEYQKLQKDLDKLEKELVKENREYETKLKELESLTNEKNQYVAERDELKAIAYRLEREIDEHNKIVQDDNKLVLELTRDQNGIKDTLTKATKINEEQNNEQQKVMKEEQKLKRDAATIKKEISNFDKKIKFLKIEIDKKADEATQANSKYDHLLEEIKLKDNLIAEFQKKNLETEAKLKQQQSLYETVRSDRNIYSKKLTETQDEIEEINRKYKIILHQISQLKEEMSAKDIKLNNEYHRANDLKKNCQSMDKQNATIKEGMAKQDENIKEFNNEIAKLQFIISESEHQKTKLKEQYEMIVSERDILGTQLIRRNEELGLLYEKIKIQQSTLAKGEHQYKEKLTMIEVLKETMRELMKKLKYFKKKVLEIPDLKKNVHGLHKELIEERLKVKALSEELENPMNVHRWRKLEGTESEVYEMITKMHTLHKYARVTQATHLQNRRGQV